MPISKPRRPQALMTGTVIAVEPKEKYNDAGGRTGDVDRYDVTLLQAGHSLVDVRFPLASWAPAAPSIGESVALIVDLGETREYGANVRVVRFASDADVEHIVSLLGALASK